MKGTRITSYNVCYTKLLRKKELSLFQVSTEEEVAIGKKTFPQAVQQMGGEYQDPALAAYVNEVGTRLARYGERPELPYEFKIVNDSSPNAFALPGGYIAISRGLLADLENEAQLAAVLGHEIGHVTARHSVQGMQRGSVITSYSIHYTKLYEYPPGRAKALGEESLTILNS